MKMVTSYIDTLTKSLRARDRGDDALEDYLLERLDSIWVQLSPIELIIVDQLTKKLSRQLVSLADLECLSMFGRELELPASSERWLTLKKIYRPTLIESKVLTRSLGSLPEKRARRSFDENHVDLTQCQFVTV